MAASAYRAPLLPPELPEGADPHPRWPIWHGPVAMACAFGCGVVGSIVLVGPLAVVAMLTDASFEDTLPALPDLATIVQDIGLVAFALLFASRKARLRPWQFGIRRPRLWPSVGWGLLALASFWVLVLPLSLLPEPSTEEVTPDVGLALLLVLGFVLIVVAPITEEFFFRGFVYGSMRSHMGSFPAALVAGSLFGAVHVTNAVIAAPLIAVFGFILCLLYEKTGSLYPPIAVHSVHNTLVALIGADTTAAVVFACMGALTVTGCFVAGALTRSGDPLALRDRARRRLVA